jgi:hypothetical protein
MYQVTVLENPWIPEAIKNGMTPKQAEFLCFEGREALYGGAAGGGKSVALLAAALQFMQVPWYHALILRRTFAMLDKADSIMAKAKEWLWHLKDSEGRGPSWTASNKTWTFPNGNTLQFGHVEHEDSVQNYQGGIWAFIGVDEATQFTENMIAYPRSRQRRKADSRLPMRWRGSANPGGVGHGHIKERYIRTKDNRDPSTPDRQFFPATIDDNPNIDRAEYVQQLQESGLDSLTIRRLLNGDWDAVEGGRFLPEYFANRWEFDPDEQHILLDDGRGVQRFLPSRRTRFGTADGAASSKSTADDTAFAAWVISPMNDLVSLGVELMKIEIPDQPARLESFYRRHALQWVGIEAVASNTALLSHCERLRMVTKRMTPKAAAVGGGKDKLSRAYPAMAMASKGRLWLPSATAARRIGYPLSKVIDQLTAFTGIEGQDANDDIVDIVSYAVEAYNAFPVTSRGSPGAHGVGGLPSMAPPAPGQVRTIAPPAKSLTANPMNPKMGVGGIGIVPPKRY